VGHQTHESQSETNDVAYTICVVQMKGVALAFLSQLLIAAEKGRGVLAFPSQPLSLVNTDGCGRPSLA
jgi:hypothetical protein